MSSHALVRILSTIFTLILCLPLPLNVSAGTGQKKVQPAISQPSVPTIDFCEFVRRPRRYFNKVLRISARWETGFEFSYLVDDRCPAKADYIAVAFANYETETKQNIDKIMSPEYGGRAIITAVGVLINPGRYYGYFHYQFLIHRFEDVTHFIVPYQAVLDGGCTYRAVVRGDKDLGLQLIPPVRMFEHYSMSLDWVNLSEFPALEKLRDNTDERTIVFSVISATEWKQIDERRRSRSVECKIIRIE